MVMKRKIYISINAEMVTTILFSSKHELYNFLSFYRKCKRDQLSERSMKEIYYIWQLAGGNVEQELKKQKLIRTKPAILTLPWYVFTDFIAKV